MVLGIFFQQTNHNILGLFSLANNVFSKHTISVSDILLKASILSYEKSQSTKPNKCDDPIIFYGSGSRLQKQIPYFQIYMSFTLMHGLCKLYLCFSIFGIIIITRRAQLLEYVHKSVEWFFMSSHSYNQVKFFFYTLHI